MRQCLFSECYWEEGDGEDELVVGEEAALSGIVKEVGLSEEESVVMCNWFEQIGLQMSRKMYLINGRDAMLHGSDASACETDEEDNHDDNGNNNDNDDDDNDNNNDNDADDGYDDKGEEDFNDSDLKFLENPFLSLVDCP